MKPKITWLVFISIIAFIALSGIQGYLIYNTYTLKSNAFIENTRSKILSIDYDQELDSIVDTWQEDLKNQIADYKNKRTTQKEMLDWLQQKADSLNKDYYRIYQEQLTGKKLGYSVNYKKNIVSVVIFDNTNDTIFPIGEKEDDPIKMYLNDIFTVPASLAGLPAISVPFGKSKDNLPLGIQLLGKHFNEQTILNAGYYLEKNNE